MRQFPSFRRTSVALALVAGAVLADPPAALLKPLLQPPATPGWEVADGATVAAESNAKAPQVVTCQDEAGESYRVQGELLLPEDKSSVQLSAAVGEVTDNKGATRRQAAVTVGLTTSADNAVDLRVGRTPQSLPLAGSRSTTWVPFAIYRINDRVQVIVQGRLAAAEMVGAGARGVTLTLSRGAQARGLTKETMPGLDPRLVPLLLDDLTNCTLGEVLPNAPADTPAGPVAVDSLPFIFPAGGAACDVAPSMAGIGGGIKVKSIYNNPNAGGNLGRLVLRLPPGPYSALHLVAFSRDLAGAVPRMTVRCGLGGFSGIFADRVVPVPGIGGGEATPEVVSRLPVTLADGQPGYLWRLKVPLADTGKLWLSPQLVNQLEFTRDVRIHVNQPDPNEFTELPAGPPSGVVVLAATLERSPVAVRHESDEPGNIFHETQPAAFRVSLTSQDARDLNVEVTAHCEGPGTAEDTATPRTSWSVTARTRLAAAATAEVPLDLTPAPLRRGWYACALEVRVDGELVQRRETSFAVLAPDTRQAMADSPFGVWCFFAAHNAAGRPDLRDYLGSIMNKGGWRWTYGGSPSSARSATPEDYQILRDRWKVTSSLHSPPEGYQRGAGWFDAEAFEAKVRPDLQKRIAEGADRTYKVLHESRSSTDLIRRFSELMGGEEYDMPAEEKAKLDQQFERVVAYCRGLKAADPGCRVVLINDYPQVGIEYMKRGFPKDAFDVFGSEGANFQREPERQPDWLSLHAIQQNWHRAKAKYGYEDKPVWYTEALYHGTNPGNLTLHQQASICTREAMLALANGVERMAAMGCVKDSSDDYRWSHWGEVGYVFRLPEGNPKPSFATFAWLTQVLDQARYAGAIETGSTSLHLLDFTRPDGSHVYPVWVPRGRQDVGLTVTGSPVVHDAYGNPVPAPVKDGVLSITVTGAPLYVTGAVVVGIASRQPAEIVRPLGEVLLSFATPAAFEVVAEASPVLDAGWDYPRFRGSFAIESGEQDGTPALKVALQPDADPRRLMQRYVELKLARPIELPGRPEALAMRIKGNGGWGRIMFELVDAKGRIWTSCGNQYSGATNSSDNKGDSYVSFDGWQTIQFPCLGEYASGDQRVAFPYNSNWWPTNHPELVELKQQFADAEAAYPAKLAEWEQAVAAHAAATKAFEAAKAAGDKTAKAPGKAPEKPRAPAFRNLGIAAVDYPLTLTRVMVAMSPSIIHVNREVPVTDPTIWLDKLGVIGAP